MKTLDELRREVDAADRDILDAFARRLNAVLSIGELKKTEGKPIFDEAREKQKIKSLENIADPLAGPHIKRLYKEIMGIAKDIESKPLFGVLGKSLPHTYSPAIHNLITSDYAYTVIERNEDELEELWALGHRGVYGGFNVTIPYKKNAFEMCDELTSSARSIGAVNTVVFRDGKSLGANTDVYGFTHMLKVNGIDPSGKNVLILGTGGASLAVNAALKNMGAGSIRFVSRTGDINYSNVYDVCSDTDIIVNCTPVGMYPDYLEVPVDIGRFDKLEAVADLIYNPSRTGLLYEAMKDGIKTAGGLSMLVAQAFKSSSFFKGADNDADAEKMVDTDEVIRVTNILEKRMRNITIIGMPGSGKTWFAKALGEHLGREVVDLDLVYAERFGKTCAETIKEDGEEVFRQRESEITREYLCKSGLVVSCGGGTVVREENHFPIKCNSVVIYNCRPLSVLSMNNRPLSASKGPEKLFEERKGLYESLADVTMSIGEKETREEYLEEAMRFYDENIST